MSNTEELTPESFIEEGKKWEKFVLANASIEEKLEGVSIDEIQHYLNSLKNKQKSFLKRTHD